MYAVYPNIFRDYLIPPLNWKDLKAGQSFNANATIQTGSSHQNT
jgi:hypothetical protein